MQRHTVEPRASNLKLMSRSHLTSAQQVVIKKQDSFVQTGKQKQSVQPAIDSDFSQWQIGSHSHPGKVREGINANGRSK